MSTPQHRSFLSIAGLLRSGSSALIDFLRPYPQLQIIDPEFRIFEVGLDELIGSLAKGEKVADDFFEKVQSTTLSYGRIPNVFDKILYQLTARMPGVATRYYQRKGKRISNYDRLFPGFTQSTTTLFEELATLSQVEPQNRIQRQRKLQNLFGTYFDNILAHFPSAKPRQIPVFNQLIRSRIAELPEILPQSKSIVVLRDPRDQFCDIVQTPHKWPEFSGPQRADNFIRMMKKKVRNSRKFIRKNPSNTHAIFFEDLVQAPDRVRKQLESFLQIPPLPSTAPESFDPNLAETKMDLYRSHPAPAEIHKIEAVMPELQGEFEALINQQNSQKTAP
jgi:hypothetical protein